MMRQPCTIPSAVPTRLAASGPVLQWVSTRIGRSAGNSKAGETELGQATVVGRRLEHDRVRLGAHGVRDRVAARDDG